MNISGIKGQRKINSVTTLFLTINPIVALAGTFYLAYNHLIAWPTVVLALIYAYAVGLGITCGYHRLFSHQSYKAKLPVRVLLALFGSAAFEGSVVDWSTDHRDHHRYTDTDLDPYSAKRGFWFSHIGWLFTLDSKKRNYNNVKDLFRSPFLVFQHRYYVAIAIVMGYVIPMLIAASWGDLLGGLFIAGGLRIAINQHLTFCINSICHIFGKQTYSDHVSAVDNWFTALLTHGEGYHNFHHKFPLDYRNGIRYYHFDPSKWLIRFLSFFGLTSDLKTVSTKRIVQCRLTMDEKKFESRLKKSRWSFNQFPPMIHNAKELVLQKVMKLDELEKAYADLKQKKLEFIDGKMQEYKLKLRFYRARMKITRKELYSSLNHWTHTMEMSYRNLANRYNAST